MGWCSEKSEKGPGDSKKDSSGFYVTLAAAVVLIVITLNYYFLHDQDNIIRGTFGDMFGVSNALFSGLAFAGVIYAIFLQRAELAIAKEELNRSKSIVEKQQAQIERQVKDGALSAFESSFFRQLELLTSIISDMDLLPRNATSGSGHPTKGRDVIAILVGRLTDSQKPDYENFYYNNGNEIGHYYRMLYNILAFVDQSCPGDKMFYARIVRAQLSNAETQLLFHNCLSDYGRKLKDLVEKYTMLKHFSPTGAEMWEMMSYGNYNPTAFSADGTPPRWLGHTFSGER